CPSLVLSLLHKRIIVITDMTKGILCTIDFSESSKDALKLAVSLAKLLNTHLTIIYPYRLVNSHNGEATEFKKQAEENAMKQFSSLEKQILFDSGVRYDFKIEVGFLSNRVKDHAKKNGLSFLVMGNKMNVTNNESFDELAESIQVPLVIVP
ncbi:MAG: universal stress protein, partial [Bacteroidota bacterium]